jgi:hypothetical protein
MKVYNLQQLLDKHMSGLYSFTFNNVTVVKPPELGAVFTYKLPDWERTYWYEKV